MEQANANGGAVIKQRIHRGEEGILKHLDEQEKSGFSVKDYCEMYDINETTFSSWIKKHKKSDEEKGFTTIEIIPSREAKPRLFANKLKRAETSSVLIIINNLIRMEVSLFCRI